MLTENLALAVGLTRAETLLRRRMDTRLGGGLGYTDFLILLELSNVRGQLRPSDLAARLLLTPSGVTRAILPLEKIGLVERTPHERDARASYVGLTAAGRTKLEEAMPSAERIVSEIFGTALTRTDRIALLGLFERLGYEIAIGYQAVD